MSSKFIDDKVAEVIAAKDRGDTQGVANAIKEAVLENDGDFAQTMQQMTESLNRQKG